LAKRKETLVAEARGKENKNLAGKKFAAAAVLAIFANLANDVVNCPRKLMGA
jgi:hypothetical protein